MDFKNYVHSAMICEELVEGVSSDKIEMFAESVFLIETELNELLGLGRLSDKIKSFSDKGDKALASAKEKGKEFVDDAKYVAKNIAKEAGEKIATDAKEVYQAHKEIAQAASKAVVGLVTKSQDAFKELWGNIPGKLTQEQSETIKDLDAIFKKMSSGKFLSGQESLKVLAAVLAGGSSKQIPSYKAYNKQLVRLQEIPGLASVRITVKSGKA